MNQSSVVFFGSSTNSTIVLSEILKHFSIVLCVTLPDRALGRKKVLTPNSVAVWAEKNQIPVLKTDKIKPEIIEQIKDSECDFLVVADFGLILPENLLSQPRYAALNIHPSLLPKYRGATPVQTTLRNGDKKTGVSIITVVKKVDAGDILAQEEIDLVGNETTKSLLPLLFQKGATLLIDVMNSYISNSQQPIPQDETQVVMTQMLTKEDGYFDFASPPKKEELDRRMRAYFPWPTAWTKIPIRGKELIVKFLPEDLIQAEGGNPMTIKEFLNGYPELKDSFLKKNLL